MSILNSLKKIGKKFNTTYTVKAQCYNCGEYQELDVPKGSTIDSFIASSAATCKNCETASLRRILPAMAQDSKKRLGAKPEPLVEKSVDKTEPVPQSVEYPIDKKSNVPLKMALRPPMIDLWTGKPIKEGKEDNQ